MSVINHQACSDSNRGCLEKECICSCVLGGRRKEMRRSIYPLVCMCTLFRGLLDYYANRSHIEVKDKNTSEFEDEDEGRDGDQELDYLQFNMLRF